MVVASERGCTYAEDLDRSGTVSVNFRNPAMPSVVSQSDAMVKQISAILRLASSDVALRELGYSEEQVRQLRSDRRKALAEIGVKSILGLVLAVRVNQAAQAQALSAPVRR